MKLTGPAYLLILLPFLPIPWSGLDLSLFKEIQQTGSKQTVINNSFIYRTVENDLVYAKLRAKYADIPVTKEILANIHWPEINDTILTFQTRLDTLRFYRAQDKIIPYYISVGSGKITFDKSLKAGTPADILKTKFKLKTVPQNLVVNELEGGLWFTFKQNKEKTKITRIVYEAVLD